MVFSKVLLTNEQLFKDEGIVRNTLYYRIAVMYIFYIGRPFI